MAYSPLRKTLILSVVVLIAVIAFGAAVGFLYDQASVHGVTCRDKRVHAKLRSLAAAQLRPPRSRVVAHGDCTLGTFGEGAEDNVVTVYETNASPHAVLAFYTAQLAAMGWERDPSGDFPDGTGRGFDRSLEDRGRRCYVSASVAAMPTGHKTRTTVRLAEDRCDPP